MSTNIISSKEEFFRTKLIPVGQLAEVYLHHMGVHHIGQSHRNDFSRVLFEAFGLASAFVISPITPVDSVHFSMMGGIVQNIIELLKKDLASLNCQKPTSEQSRTFRASQETVLHRLAPYLDLLLKTMLYGPKERAAWLMKFMAIVTPLTPRRRYNKWRTFVCNLDFGLNMQKMGLSEVSRKVPVLGSSQGKAEAPMLWRKCFYLDWTSGKNLTPGRPYLPAGMDVKSTSGGLLEVTQSFDSRKALKSVLAAMPKALTEEGEGLEVVLFSKTCDYTELVATVAEAAKWVAAQGAKAEATRVLLTQAAEVSKVEALRAKLASTFSPEELALLSKIAVLPIIPAKSKTAARPRVRKS